MVRVTLPERNKYCVRCINNFLSKSFDIAKETAFCDTGKVKFRQSERSLEVDPRQPRSQGPLLPVLKSERKSQFISKHSAGGCGGGSQRKKTGVRVCNLFTHAYGLNLRIPNPIYDLAKNLLFTTGSQKKP